ncbi:hypothetical protein UFOVP581_36 [uncultured Caudovirales phage]|uniref:Uncharacterized protein n=1 Tax=uncultured Caudovirales phage TaxID=2100421 RepID=A0A6J5PAY0_9CAUD|nr:hypothetical protein UFOVP581_36 [uncultured Caudovirales phage]
MSNITKIIKHAIVKDESGSQFQLCEFHYNVWGRDMVSVLDTKIENGIQSVIEGDGFIKTGFKI